MRTNSRTISELFAHKGHIYVYCPDAALREAFARDLDAQGFTFGDGVRATERARDFGEIMAVSRDRTVCFCGYASHVRCGSLRDPVYVREDSSRGCTRVDYARFLRGERDYVIRGPHDVAIDEARRGIRDAFLTGQPLTAEQRSILREFLAGLSEEEAVK